MPPSGEDEGDHRPTAPTTPRKYNDAHKANHGTPTTPKRRSPGGDGPSPARRRAHSKKGEPTLLTDFFLGRQTPERVAAERAERKRRLALEAEQAELRAEEDKVAQHDMKQSAVQRLQQPSGVRDRVRTWQKFNGVDAVVGNPQYAATEPSDVAFDGDELESVTEEDRVRIKMRLKQQSVAKMAQTIAASVENREDDAQDAGPSISPKKRVVSDRNWMKQRNRKSPPRKVSPTLSRTSSRKHGLPSNFVSQSTQDSSSSRVKDWASKIDSDSRSEVSTYVPRKPKSGNDTIRVTPTRRRGYDDGIRVTGSSSSSVIRDDGIRVRPTASEVSFPGQTYKPPRRRSKSQAGTRSAGSSELSTVSSRVSEFERKGSGTTHDEEGKTRPSAAKRKERAKSFHAGVDSRLKSLQDDDSALGVESDLSSSLTAKTLADLPGDIPFGHSAFSELDLSVGGTGKSRPKKPTVERKSSLKGVPKVFRKVMEEGKKIIQDMNEPPPRPQTSNAPPSIEKWLTTTLDVDPFVDTPAGRPKTASEAEPKQTSKSTPKSTPRNTPKSAPQRRQSTPGDVASDVTDETATQEHSRNANQSTPKQESKASPAPESPTPTGLKRRSAMKGSPSKPLAKGGQFFGMLKEAFKGESAAYTPPPKVYQSQEQRKFDPRDGSVIDDDTILSSALSGSEVTASELSQSTTSTTQDDGQKLASPRYRPPTSGQHELSTIMSEDDNSSAIGSDLSSHKTESTLTQSTVLTKASDHSESKREPGLKRRLTRHSDLVSVLSLPDNSGIPQGMVNNRSRPSLRRNKGDVTGDDLLREFTGDEQLYMRELRTLVDGVIPVLLSDVVNGSNATELFGSSKPSSDLEKISKSVVKMGVALEKLKAAHKKAPSSDIRRLVHWAHGVVPIYNSYVSAWRLGFQDVVVNLAPAGKEPDSLIDGLPRDDAGDLVNEEGERVAVAHLMKRPLVRIKQMTKLIQCANDIIKSIETGDLLRDFESLHDKARRRNREEIARITDEDAFTSDITRSRELRTLDATESTYIDPTLQVNAKDVFSLDLVHSNGQRMECRVELIYRDSSKDINRDGDLLIREVGDNKKTYLLFPAIPMSVISARTGDGNFDMVVMIRGTYKGKLWHELLTLYADNEDQILDWLDLLPVSPVPPREPEPSIVGDDEDAVSVRNVPVGAQYPHGRPLSPLVESPESHLSPRRQRPDSSKYADPQRTPTRGGSVRDRVVSDMVPAPLNVRGKRSPRPATENDDVPPPPPTHRIPPSKALRNDEPDLQPSAKDQLKRRGSSPLKHEYLPSDNSSASGISSRNESEEEESDDDDDDDLDSMDIPETDIGVCVGDSKQPGMMSDTSLTPSKSASQVYENSQREPENITRYLASISRWSDKGVWKDISPQPCSVVVTNGLIEAYAYRPAGGRGRSQSTGASGVVLDDQPLIALDLTPLVLIRQSTALDLEVRSSLQPHCLLQQSMASGNFRFRCHNAPECYTLYMAVHHSRLNNQKFIQLENEARFKNFGERKPQQDDGSASSKRRSWFGRKNSYRGSVRAPSQDGGSATPSSTPSAASFLQRLTGAGNGSFNLERSSVDRHGYPASGQNSLYTSSSGSGSGHHSPSASFGNSNYRTESMDSENIRIRLHLLVSSAKWEDMGNCTLQIRRPPPGWRQALRADHGLEKRVTVITTPKKEMEQPKIMLDAVLGSGCFSSMGARGIVCGVWEEVKGADGVVGAVPHTGATGGNIKKWCFQLTNAAEASWVLRLVHQEVFMT